MKRMKFKWQIARSFCAVLIFAALVAPAGSLLRAQTSPEAPQTTAAKIPADQLDALVAPIALYPDPLLSQTLVASTYPLEIVQLQQWLEKNKDLTKPGNEKKMTEKVSKQPWDPSIQAMAALPDVVKWLAGDIQWTTDLGNAFLAQQNDVMDAVQRMRGKAQEKGSLASNDKQTVQTQVVESKSVIVIQQADPQVVYVPSYDPVYAYGAIGYPYPPISYPYYGGAVAAGVIGFGVGLAVGAAWGGGGWGWGCGWGGNDININRNNSFNRNTNINNISGGNRINGGNKWQHNPTHRGGAPYGDRGTANKFGGTARGDSLANRQSGARNQIGQQGGRLQSSNRPTTSTRDNAPRAGDRGNAGSRDMGGNRGNDRGNAGNRDMGGNRGNDRGNAGNRDMGGNRGGDRSNMGGNRGSSDRMGSRDMGRGGGGGFGSGSSGFGGSSARSSSSRGSSSMGGSRGGGFGGGGGGMRGGGGGGRRR
jgi:hypothetical protein